MQHKDSSAHLITPEQANTLPALFRERVARTPEATAYRFFDALNGAWTDISWSQVARQVERWQAALLREQLTPGDRVAIMARNSHLWVIFDQAALSLGLVVVPLFANDRSENVQYILENAGVKLLVIGPPAEWNKLQGRLDDLDELRTVVSLAGLDDATHPRLQPLADWLGEDDRPPPVLPLQQPDQLATLVYTSGTTGAPKGVMLSHRNILSNAWSGYQAIPVFPRDLFLSFLPLSHSLERTIGYYLPMMAGSTVVHSRGIPELARDLREIRPTCLVSVPRIYERIHARMREDLARVPGASRLFSLAVNSGWRRFEQRQGRGGWSPLQLLWPALKPLVADKLAAALGGRLRVALSGGAALSPEIARVFLGLGLPILQGYGLTETSPVVSVNRLDDNRPGSIGPPVPGVEVRTAEKGELLVRGPNVMQGYWDNAEASAAIIDRDGWLHTGDKAALRDGHLYLTGRIKDIIVLSTGEKVSPADMETALTADPLFEQAMVVGEQRPYLSALVVIDPEQWRRLGLDRIEDPAECERLLLERAAARLRDFPAYADVKRLTWLREAWTVDNGMLTPILKLKRGRICELHALDIERMYAGHSMPLPGGTVQEAG